MNNLPIDFVKLQEGGTCWFHASLNGWLLSSKGRELLLIMLHEFKKKYSLSNSNTTCPRRGTLPLGYFWHYVENIITGKSWNLMRIVYKYKVGNVIKNVNRVAANMSIENYIASGPNVRLRERLSGIVNKARVNPHNFVNSYLIHNVGLRNAVHPTEPLKLIDIYRHFGINLKTQMNLAKAGINTVNKLKSRLNKSLFTNEKHYNQLNRYFKAPQTEYGIKKTMGGTKNDAIDFCKLLFGSLYSQRAANANPTTLVVSTPYQDENPREITLNGVKFVLSHAFLHLSGYKGRDPGNHTVCGFIYNGQQYIMDSNQVVFTKINWAATSGLSQFITLTGSKSFIAQDSLVFYVRDDVKSYIPNMNALAARRNIMVKYSKIQNLMKSGATKNAYKLLLSLPNKNNEQYKNIKRLLNSALNASAKKMLNAVKKLPNKSPMLRSIFNSHKNLPHFQAVRNEIQRKMSSFIHTVNT